MQDTIRAAPIFDIGANPDEGIVEAHSSQERATQKLAAVVTDVSEHGHPPRSCALQKKQLCPVNRNRGAFAFMKIPTPHKPPLSSCTSNCFHAFTAIIFKSRLFHFVSSLGGSGLCFLLHLQTFLDSVGTAPSPCALRRQYLERRKVGVCPHHTRTLHCDRTPWFCGFRRLASFTSCKPKYK